MVTDHDIGLAVQRWVDCQIQGNDGITSRKGRKGIDKDAADSVWVAIPLVGCLMVANHGIGLAVERWMDGQIQGNDGITSG